MNILEKITERTKERIEEEKKIVPLEEDRRQAEEKGIKDKYIFMIGGAPVSGEYAKQVHADYYTTDAAAAADVAKNVLKSKK